eukprot:1161668-Pelagomonas_calceolata.AAC.4
MVGWLALAKNCLQNSLQTFLGTSHCLLRPHDTAGLLSSFVWEDSQHFRVGVGLGGPGQQESREFPPPQSYRTEGADGDLANENSIIGKGRAYIEACDQRSSRGKACCAERLCLPEPKTPNNAVESWFLRTRCPESSSPECRIA